MAWLGGHHRTSSGYRGRVSPLTRIIAAITAAAMLIATVAGGAFLALGGLDRVRDAQAVTVPEEYREVIIEAAQRCPAVPPEVLAAQLASESSWITDAVSPAGAQGIAQFMPETWEQFGIDADGDGIADVWNPIDAIHSAAALNCVNRRLVADVPGDELTNILAAYNAGFNNVVRYGGVPPFAETQNYIERIIRRAQSIDLSVNF
jgi:soluble lytic murein transglycosylase-like protein